MKTININSNITINWKIWRGVNKVEEDFVGSKLRVFLIGTENTYYLRPNAVGGVLTMTIAPGTLAAGSYDLKAIWEKNGGRTLMSSTRSNIFGITEAEEANPKDEVMQIVSYVESYGRDGLSAFEIAVLRGLNRGCRSEAEWINSLYAGGEGGGGGICMLGTDITIGGTALGDDLLNRADELEGHLNGNVLDGGTPLNLLFKVLLSKAKEIEQPNPVVEPGSVVNNPGTVSVQADYKGTRPNGYVEVKCTYEPSNPIVTPPSIKEMTWGYATDADGNDKHMGEDDGEIIGKDPTLEERKDNGVILVTVENGAEVTDNRDGTYRFTPKVGNNIIRVEYDEGNIHYTIEELHVWPLNSEYRVYSEEGEKVDREVGVLKCGPIYGTAEYPHPTPQPSNYEKTQGGVSFSGGSISITDTTEAEVGSNATFKISSAYGTATKADSTIMNEGDINYGYKTSQTATEIHKNDITKAVTLDKISDGSIVVKHNGTPLTPANGVYSFKVVDGANTVTAALTNPKFKGTAEGVTIYPLNEDLETGEAMTVTAVNKEVGGNMVNATQWAFNKVLPAYLHYFNGEEYTDVVLEYNGIASNKDASNGNIINGVMYDPFYIIIPDKYSAESIKIFQWYPIAVPPSIPVPMYVEATPEITIDSSYDTPDGYVAYKCEDSNFSDGTYYITINK